MLNLSLRDLRHLLVVSEELHFGRAAERLGIAQPHLSEAIRRLEDLAKVRLFTRRPRVRLTPAGEIVVAMARELTDEIEREFDHARAVVSGKMGTVRLGFTESAQLTDLPLALKEFQQSQPEIRLSVLEGTSSQLWAMLEQQALDLIISGEARPHEAIRSAPLINATLQLVMPEDHPLVLAGHEVISLNQLHDEEFVLFPRHAAPFYYDHIMRCCSLAGLAPQVVQEADSISLIVALILAGFGISFEQSEASKFAIPGIAMLPIAERPSSTVWLSYVPPLLTPSGRIFRDQLLTLSAAAD